MRNIYHYEHPRFPILGSGSDAIVRRRRTEGELEPQTHGATEPLTAKTP
jgi:hypothetical protein